MMNFTQMVYSFLAMIVTVYVAHHTGATDLGLGLLAFLAHAFHVSVTKNLDANSGI